MAGGLLPSEAVLLGANVPQVGLAETIFTNSDLLKVVPIIPGNSAAGHIYNREVALPKGGPVPLNSGTVPQGSLSIAQSTVAYKYFGGDVGIDPRMANLTNGVQDLFELTADRQVKSLAMDLDRDVVQASIAVDANNFNGLRALSTASAAYGYDFGGGPVTKRGMDTMWNRLHPLARRSAVWIAMGASEVDIREFLGVNANAADRMAEAFGRPMIHLHDRPVLVSENVTADEDAAGAAGGGNLCSLYLVGFDPSGQQGVFGIVPPRADLALAIALLGPAGSMINRTSRVMFSFTMALPSPFWLIRGYNILNN